MKQLTRAVFIIVAIFLSATTLKAQMVADNSKWSFEAKKVNGNVYDIIFHLSLPKDWHIYAMNPGGDGSLYPPAFTFNKNKQVKLIGTVKEKGKLEKIKIDGIDGIINEYKNKVDYIQRAEINGNTTISGTYSYQICDESKCINPTTKDFTLKVTDAGEVDATANNTDTISTSNLDTSQKSTASTAIPTSNNTTVKDSTKADGITSTTKSSSTEEQSLLTLFFLALVGGLAAVLTPCVYSMIPITVSFFTKRSKTRKEGIKNALYYASSIVIIFTSLGVLVTLLFGATALNSLSTNWIANLFFFVVFVIFGISFLGAFEITLPSSLTNKTDSKAGLGSFSGIFFMALTLAIVSFSCTGPIVGPLLVAAGKGGLLGPTIGMFGFSLGLALPFALFAIFPGMLNNIAQSGGWMNQVKVVLGFVELMLALKFLSNADLAQGWRLLDREIFIALWIVLSILIGIYLLGKLKLSKDDANPENDFGQQYVGLPKLFMAIGAFSFAVYLLPGMWGAPLNGVSAFVPPMGTFEAFGGSSATANTNNEHKEGGPVKYVSEMKIYEPQVVKSMGLETYYDYEEAIAASIKYKKPIMLDFTGINCVNCRKMESQVWSNPEVAKRLKEDFIVASLYCDINKITLPEKEQFYSKDLNTQVTTLGNKNAHIQAAQFGSNSQPFYFYIDEKGNKLADNGYSYDPDVQKFVKHLESVKENYKKTHP